jgi:hypothetical protein
MREFEQHVFLLRCASSTHDQACPDLARVRDKDAAHFARRDAGSVVHVLRAGFDTADAGKAELGVMMVLAVFASSCLDSNQQGVS